MIGFGRYELELDWADRLNAKWSALMLFVLALVTFAAPLVTDPVTCWTPAQFGDKQNLYADRSVYLGDASFFLHELDTQASQIGPNLRILPMILFLQAVCFMAPYALWYAARPYLALEFSDSQTSTLAHLLLESTKSRPVIMSLSYLLVKLFSVINLLVQFVTLSVVVGSRLNFLHNTENNLPYFPTKLWANFNVRQMQILHQYTVQCMIPINDTYVRVLIFLWYWILFVGLITGLSFLFSLVTTLLPDLRVRPLVTYIRGQDQANPPSPAAVRFWADKSLGMDGVLLLSLTARAQGPLLAARLAQEAWALQPQPLETAPVSPLSAETIPLDTLAPSQKTEKAAIHDNLLAQEVPF